MQHSSMLRKISKGGRGGRVVLGIRGEDGRPSDFNRGLYWGKFVAWIMNDERLFPPIPTLDVVCEHW